MQASTLLPGLLVSLKTSIRGNVAYKTVDLETDHITAEGERRARWETERTITDPEEHERAVSARSLARSKVQGACVTSAFGLLCPEAKQRQLDDAVTEARAIVEDFNAGARLTRLNFYIIAGRIAPDDIEAIRAINSEMADLMAMMSEGLKNLDVGKVREAANKARSVGSMLTPEAQERVKSAIDAARKAARDIVAMGEGAAVEIDLAAVRKVQEARTSFLDLEDDAAEMQAAQPGARTVDVDLSDVPEDDEIKFAPVQTRMFDF